MNKIISFAKFNVCQSVILLDFMHKKIYNISSYDGLCRLKTKVVLLTWQKLLKLPRTDF